MALFCGTVGGELENLCQAPNTGQLVAGIGRGKAEPSLSDANCVITLVKEGGGGGGKLSVLWFNSIIIFHVLFITSINNPIILE